MSTFYTYHVLPPITEPFLIVSELSRMGRYLMEVMSILHDSMERGIKVYAIKEGYELGNSINSKVFAFAFGLSAEIERTLISQRTKEEKIKDLLRKKVSVSAIGRILGVHRLTVDNFIKTRKLRDDV